MVDLGLRLETIADDMADVGGNGTGRHGHIAREIPRTAAQVAKLRQQIGIGRAFSRMPTPRWTPAGLAALVAAVERHAEQGPRLCPLKPGSRVEVTDDTVNEVRRGQCNSGNSALRFRLAHADTP